MVEVVEVVEVEVEGPAWEEEEGEDGLPEERVGVVCRDADSVSGGSVIDVSGVVCWAVRV